MAKIREKLDAEQVAKIVADLLAAEKAKEPKRLPFLHPKSLPLWAAAGTLTLGLFGLWANIQGCEKKKIVHDLHDEAVPVYFNRVDSLCGYDWRKEIHDSCIAHDKKKK